MIWPYILLSVAIAMICCGMIARMKGRSSLFALFGLLLPFGLIFVVLLDPAPNRGNEKPVLPIHLVIALIGFPGGIIISLLLSLAFAQAYSLSMLFDVEQISLSKC